MPDKFVALLKDGEVVAFPTETVYGLGADARNPDAVKKVFETKGRPTDNPLIIHISDIKQVSDFAAEITDDAQKLMKTFWPGPLTLIFKKKPEVLDIITAGLDTVALRWPQHPLSQQLIAQAGPLVAPSANSSGKPSPTKPEHITEDFGDDFPVIKAGETDIGLESTVLDISSEPYRIYRPGAISAAEIEDVVHTEVMMALESPKNTAAKSPGTKYSHYAPDAEVKWLTDQPDFNENALYLLHGDEKVPGAEISSQDKNVIHYGKNYRRMAHELYDRFRQADHLGLQNIFIQPFAEKQLQEALVQALQNRISKAIG